MDNYKTIERKLRDLEPFNGNTLTAFYVGDVYKVYSYRTLIAEVGNMGTKVVSSAKYSVTTSRQQNLIRRVWAVA